MAKSCGWPHQFISKLKDRNPLLNQYNLVYKIDCIDCDGTYIGQAKQYLQSKTFGHKYSIRTENSECRMLSIHSTNRRHNWDKERNLEKILILEMIEILINKNSINKMSDMNCFSNIYKHILF